MKNAASGLAVFFGFVLVSVVTPAKAYGQGSAISFDSIIVEGNHRVAAQRVIALSGLVPGLATNFLDVQRAITALYSSGQFADVEVTQATIDGRTVLRLEVTENPLVTSWTVAGVEKLTERSVRGKVEVSSGRPFSPHVAEGSRLAIDSLYRGEGYYAATVEMRMDVADSGWSVRVVFDIDEGSKVAISRIIIEGNEQISDADVVAHMSTGTEGFLWFRKGEYDEDKLEIDLREKLPAFYSSRGFVDFRALSDTLIVNSETGKGTLIVTVDEGRQYRVGVFEVVGNRQYPNNIIERYFPFGNTEATGFMGLGGSRDGAQTFDAEKWEEATADVSTLYYNTGYIYARVDAQVTKRVDENGDGVVDLRWQITEGTPAVINRVNIIGNTVTHENVIRRALVMLPGDVFRQDALLRSYQNVSNVGFFEQPLAFPDVEPANRQGDVDITFRVTERNTGNINFGASVGQGTGIGGFIGLEQPNLFGRGKNASFQWQFGRNISDFRVSYTDPALRGALMSGSISLHNTRTRFTIADFGTIRTRGGTIQIGFPLLGSRFTRVFTSYTLEESKFGTESGDALANTFVCADCVLSSLNVTVLRDTRIGLPFATGGAMHRFEIAQVGGPLQGSGNFRRSTFEGRWYAPLAQLGGEDPASSSLQFVLGYTVKAGFVWGDAGPHFRQLFSMGGTQFGIPLRGYSEFSITPQGFDPLASGRRANTVAAFGASYFAMTGEIGLRFSQSIYFSTYLDAGNVWSKPGQFNPTRLLRGAGLGVSMLSPLGPIGLDYAYAFDRLDVDGNADPAWKFHFRLGQFF